MSERYYHVNYSSSIVPIVENLKSIPPCLFFLDKITLWEWLLLKRSTGLVSMCPRQLDRKISNPLNSILSFVLRNFPSDLVMNSSASQIVKRNKSCDNCRTRKKKCDGKEVCGACKLLLSKIPDTSCIYSLTSRTVIKKISFKQKVIELEAKVAQLKESVINSVLINELEADCDQPVQITDHETLSPSPNQFEKLPGNTIDGVRTIQLYADNSTSVFYNLHSNLMKCWILFSKATLDDVYKLFYDTIEAGQKFGFFQNASFIFPNKILTEINSYSTRTLSKQEQRQNGILWNLCLMIDSFQSVTFSQNFIIVESGEYSHYNLPVLPKSVSEFQISNAFLSDITAGVVESTDIKQLSLIENQRKCVRIHRWLIHFQSLLTPENLFTNAELKQLLLNLHYTTMVQIPIPLAECFGQFTSKKSMSELSQSVPRFESPLLLAYKVILLLMASIHSLSIQLNVDLKLPLAKIEGMKYDLYTSSEIILICLRAFAYFLMIEADTAVDLQDHSLKMSVKIIEQSLSLMFCGEICRLSIKSNVPDIANQLEIVDIVKKKLFPRISGKGWEWKLAAYYAFKIQEYVS